MEKKEYFGLLKGGEGNQMEGGKAAKERFCASKYQEKSCNQMSRLLSLSPSLHFSFFLPLHLAFLSPHPFILLPPFILSLFPADINLFSASLYNLPLSPVFLSLRALSKAGCWLGEKDGESEVVSIPLSLQIAAHSVSLLSLSLLVVTFSLSACYFLSLSFFSLFPPPFSIHSLSLSLTHIQVLFHTCSSLFTASSVLFFLTVSLELSPILCLSLERVHERAFSPLNVV